MTETVSTVVATTLATRIHSLLNDIENAMLNNRPVSAMTTELKAVAHTLHDHLEGLVKGEDAIAAAQSAADVQARATAASTLVDGAEVQKVDTVSAATSTVTAAPAAVDTSKTADTAAAPGADTAAAAATDPKPGADTAQAS